MENLGPSSEFPGDSQPYVPPSAASIAEAQNKLDALRLLVGQCRLYSQAKRWAHLRAIGIGIIAVAAPIFSLTWPESGAVLGAISGAWIFVSRTLFVKFEKELAAQAAVLQERFDIRVFGMPEVSYRVWTLSPEELSRLVGSVNEVKATVEQQKLLDWYPIDQTLGGKEAIAIAQRANTAYSDLLLRVNAKWFRPSGVLAESCREARRL